MVGHPIPPELPSAAQFRERSGWIDRLIERETGCERLDLSPQAAALFAEMRMCFASGAWLASLILAQSALDAELNQGSIDGLTQNEIRFGADYVWLRNRRNDLLHADDPRPAVTCHDLERDAGNLEKDTRRAIELLVRAVGETGAAG